ncbi:hypothetical protein SAMD00019534_049780 [Acytostelium subglobosum LB1]|uniref:hypothetical protein n=1 Tax=Acytostelium subglobosum LB1 TaxID=1410327 RepID=UPI000644AB26|nr:hypothetical protein SAMD00019534_049780 [Acytostelium subglobosum LB1]GAM21803.1 hypothetical protein SAMD00019534_049780 [Acytostelium subglobosum LB1]|eukprot:XP_012754903.1 hypothetical protein SAMD00019534_049780 [Acytostelium subglobosum LB1]
MQSPHTSPPLPILPSFVGSSVNIQHHANAWDNAGSSGSPSSHSFTQHQQPHQSTNGHFASVSDDILSSLSISTANNNNNNNNNNVLSMSGGSIVGKPIAKISQLKKSNTEIHPVSKLNGSNLGSPSSTVSSPLYQTAKLTPNSIVPNHFQPYQLQQQLQSLQDQQQQQQQLQQLQQQQQVIGQMYHPNGMVNNNNNSYGVIQQPYGTSPGSSHNHPGVMSTMRMNKQQQQQQQQQPSQPNGTMMRGHQKSVVQGEYVPNQYIMRQYYGMGPSVGQQPPQPLQQTYPYTNNNNNTIVSPMVNYLPQQQQQQQQSKPFKLDAPKDGRCNIHQEPNRSYCFNDDCQTSLCARCTEQSGHQGHNVILYQDLAKRIAEENTSLRSSLLRLKSYLEVEGEIVNRLASKNSAEEAKEKLRRDMHQYLDEAFKQIDKEYFEYREKIDSKRDKIGHLLKEIDRERGDKPGSAQFGQHLSGLAGGVGGSTSAKSGGANGGAMGNGNGGSRSGGKLIDINNQKNHYMELFEKVSEVVVTPNESIQWDYQQQQQNRQSNINIIQPQQSATTTTTTSTTTTPTTTTTTTPTACIINNPANIFNSNNVLKVSTLPFKCTLKYIYAIGGQARKSVERYSIEQNKWTFVANMNTLRSRFSAIYDGRQHIYVFGGEAKTNDRITPEKTVERYNIMSDSWEVLKHMPKQRSRHATAYDGQRYIYIIGGKDATWFTSEVLRYDMFTQEYTQMRPMKTPRSDISAVYDGKGSIYVIGGYDSKALDIIEQYDIATDTWSSVKKMKKPRDGPGAVYDGKGSIYVMGGSVSSHNISNSLERYDVEKGDWVPLANMFKPVDVRNSVVYDGDNSLYVIGGYFSEVLSDACKYNIDTNVWESLKPMNEAREGNALVYVSVDIN